MPLYEYECVSCGERQELFFKIAHCPESVKCEECGEIAVKIITAGHGAIQCDSMIDVPWLASAVDNLQPDGERRVETRGEYKQYMKDHGIIPIG